MALDSAQIRHQNLLALFERFRLAHAHLPQRGLLKAFAGELGLSDRYLSHLKCNRKNIGSQVARGIEQSLSLPHGWLDRDHAADEALIETDDAAERMFLETVRMLYRAEPEGMRRLVMDVLQRKLDAAHATPKPPPSRVPRVHRRAA